MQDVAGQMLHPSGLFALLDKVQRRNEAAGRIMPAHQRFDPDHGFRREVDFGLVDAVNLAGFHRLVDPRAERYVPEEIGLGPRFGDGDWIMGFGRFLGRRDGSSQARGRIALDRCDPEGNAYIDREAADLDRGGKDRAQSFEMLYDGIGFVARHMPAEAMAFAVNREVWIGGAQPVDELENIAALVVRP